MDAQQRDIDNAALLERMAEWALGVRDRTQTSLWFIGVVIFAIVFAVRTGLSTDWILLVLAVFAIVFSWLMRKKTQREWQRYEFARQHFQALLESRKTLQSMTKEERYEVKPEVVGFLLDTFLPGGLEHPVFWNDVEEGVMRPATRRMKLESMGLHSRGDNFPNYNEVEYAWDRYGEIDPEREWIGRLRVRGGYVESLDKWRAAVEENQNRWNPKPPDGTK
jgi:hypothetical protein